MCAVERGYILFTFAFWCATGKGSSNMRHLPTLLSYSIDTFWKTCRICPDEQPGKCPDSLQLPQITLIKKLIHIFTTSQRYLSMHIKQAEKWHCDIDVGWSLPPVAHNCIKKRNTLQTSSRHFTQVAPPKAKVRKATTTQLFPLRHSCAMTTTPGFKFH